MPIASHTNLIPSIRRDVGRDGSALVGFDFPIGLPEQYARTAGIKEFKSFLLQLGAGEWVSFFEVAKSSTEISIRRPFYPHKPDGTKHQHLISALGVQGIDALRRECGIKNSGRNAACPLFWTLGANQVGKGAIIGWRDVLAPALRDDKGVFLWPFDGFLDDLLTAAHARVQPHSLMSQTRVTLPAYVASPTPYPVEPVSQTYVTREDSVSVPRIFLPDPSLITRV